eukprot:16100697-Heterocapsa_arctica.AAC.1
MDARCRTALKRPRRRPGADDLKAGDECEFSKASKGTSHEKEPWQGPAIITDMSQIKETGSLGIRWQGRHLQVTSQRIRPRLPYIYFGENVHPKIMKTLWASLVRCQPALQGCTASTSRTPSSALTR